MPVHCEQKENTIDTKQHLQYLMKSVYKYTMQFVNKLPLKEGTQSVVFYIKYYMESFSANKG